MKKLNIGQEIEAEIVAITEDCIFLDLNEKSEGVLSKSELQNEDGTCKVKCGQKIKAFFTGEKNGEMRFTTKIAGEQADKELLEQAWKNGIPVEGHVEKEIKGGYEIKIGTTRAFCPYSQMGFRQKDSADSFVGKHLTFIIQEYKENGKNILVSNRAVLELAHKSNIESLQERLKVGMIVTGTVVSVQEYGAFVLVEGFQALLPISEIGRGRVQDINSVIKEGQTIQAKIISTDWNKERVSLSMKSLQADPWDSVTEKYPVESKHKGTIARVTDYGLFVTLEPGLDGLVHISELETEGRNTNLRVKFKAGTEMDVTIKAVDIAQKRLSLKPTTSNDQDIAAQKYINNQDDSDTYNPFAALLKR